jgi:cytochrome c553
MKKRKQRSEESRRKFSLLAKERGFGKWMRGRFGELSNQWSGDSVGYNKLHEWIRLHWEKPSQCEQCGKESKLDWANIDGKYLRSVRKSWIAICRSCHLTMDMTNERKRKISESMKKYIASSPEALRRMGRIGSLPRKKRAKVEIKLDLPQKAPVASHDAPDEAKPPETKETPIPVKKVAKKLK